MLLRAVTFTTLVLLQGLHSVQAFEPKNMAVSGFTTIPIGHFEYCKRAPADCLENNVRSAASVDKALFAKIRVMNIDVNSSFEAKHDIDIYGVNEYWAVPRRYADCEDYALEKRRRLVEEFGVSPANALITVVKRRNHRNEGHAVLTLRTTDGDFILDNLTDRIFLWSDTRHKFEFVKRQSVGNSAKWVSIDDGSTEDATSAVR